jgi:superoxide dismutase
MWYSNGIQFLICGDININYLENCKKRQQLDALLQTYNITGTVTFPTHISDTSATAIDSIFITKTKKYDIYPYVTGLSDHDAQIIILKNSILKKYKNNNITVRDINDHSILEFQLLMSYENWEEIFEEDDVNISFNKFHNTFIRNFNSCFVKKQIKINTYLRPWKTKGIKTSCNRKRELYQMMRDNINNNTSKIELRIYYKRYCRLLSIVIKEAKRLHYKEIITKSRNKIKTTWKIISKETNKSTIEDTIQSLRINDQVIFNQSIIANELNEYFLNIAGSNSNKHNVNKDVEINPLHFLSKHFIQPFKDMRWSYTTTKEISEIIKTLKDKNSSGYDEIT